MKSLLKFQYSGSQPRHFPIIFGKKKKNVLLQENPVGESLIYPHINLKMLIEITNDSFNYKETHQEEF
jgi:hypothetical protein